MRAARTVLCATGALLALLAATTARGEAWGSTVYVTNHSSTLADGQVADALVAFQQAVNEDFAPSWHEGANLRLVDTAPAGGWTIDLVDTPDCFFCEGYHTLTAGVPSAVVGVDGFDWQIVFSHELFELLGNPFISNGVLVGNRWWAKEAADPVEADWMGYFRQAPSGSWVHVSDFVTPAWFRRRSVGPWDFMGRCSRPLRVLPDGYQLVWSHGGWEATG